MTNMKTDKRTPKVRTHLDRLLTTARINKGIASARITKTFRADDDSVDHPLTWHGNSIGVPPAAMMPARTRLARVRWWRLQGDRSVTREMKRSYGVSDVVTPRSKVVSSSQTHPSQSERCQ